MDTELGLDVEPSRCRRCESITACEHAAAVEPSDSRVVQAEPLQDGWNVDADLPTPPGPDAKPDGRAPLELQQELPARAQRAVLALAVNGEQVEADDDAPAQRARDAQAAAEDASGAAAVVGAARGLQDLSLA